LRLLKHFGYAAVALVIVGSVNGCEEDTTRPPAPPPPPPISLELYNTSQGETRRLINDDVYDIIVDGQNRVWIATDEGVSMMDGTNPAVFYDDFNKIPNRKCRALAEMNGRIFVGTWGGGGAYFDEAVDDSLWTPIPVAGQGQNFGLVDGQITSMASDYNDLHVWFATVNGLSRYTDNPTLPMNQRFGNFSGRLAGQRLLTSIMVYSHPQKGREVWIAKQDAGLQVLRFNAGQADQVFRTSNSAIPSEHCADVDVDPLTNMPWSGYSDRGVAMTDVDNRLWTNLTRVDGYHSDLVSSVAVRSNGDVWTGTQTGVSRRKPDGTITNFLVGSGLPTSRVRTVYVDDNDNVWIGFISGGAARVLNP
jgi:ligand-binding sensor domain-containing protein